MNDRNQSHAQETRTPRSGAAARLIVADDHDLARAGLIGLLSSEPSLEIVAEAGNGREAVTRCRLLRPDLVLMDVRMPEMDGLEATRHIKDECPETSVIIITMHEDPDYLFQAIRAGAAGYVLKGSSKAEIVGAVRRVLGGDSLLDQRVMTDLLQRLAREETQGAVPALQELTQREREILPLIVQGKTNPEIGAELVISQGTVKAHVQHIIGKLGVSDRTQAAVRAVQLGLVPSERA
jgi:DNA-binding NarL/FixJ family response regulator